MYEIQSRSERSPRQLLSAISMKSELLYTKKKKNKVSKDSYLTKILFSEVIVT